MRSYSAAARRESLLMQTNQIDPEDTVWVAPRWFETSSGGEDGTETSDVTLGLEDLTETSGEGCDTTDRIMDEEPNSGCNSTKEQQQDITYKF